VGAHLQRWNELLGQQRFLRVAVVQLWYVREVVVQLRYQQEVVVQLRYQHEVVQQQRCLRLAVLKYQLVVEPLKFQQAEVQLQ
jgi:hypothetical protein